MTPSLPGFQLSAFWRRWTLCTRISSSKHVTLFTYVHKLARTPTLHNAPMLRSQVGHYPRLEMPSDGKEQVPGGIFNGISHNSGGRGSSNARPEEIETIRSRYRQGRHNLNEMPVILAQRWWVYRYSPAVPLVFVECTLLVIEDGLLHWNWFESQLLWWLVDVRWYKVILWKTS